MQGEIKERWLQLCERAATEQDPAKLLQLVHEINDLLEAKHARLKQPHPEDKSVRARSAPPDKSQVA